MVANPARGRTVRRISLVAGVAATVLLLPGVAHLYTEVRWFRSLGHEPVFGTIVGAELTVAALAGLFMAGVLLANLLLALRLSGRPLVVARLQGLQVPRLRLALAAASLVVGFAAATTAAPLWQEWLQFWHRVPFGARDPIFGRDVSYYVFELPLLQGVSSLLLWSIGLAAAGSVGIYVWRGATMVVDRTVVVERRARVHVSLLAAAFFLALGFDAHLETAGLLYSRVGPVAGASWADVHATLPALRLLLGAALLAAVLVGASGFRRRWVLAVGGVGLYALVSLLGVRLVPSLVHRVSVVPNELQREAPYIRYNIAATRKAYALDAVVERQLPGEAGLDAADIARNRGTVDNVRLWDHQPLLSTFAQIQEIRTYYDFVSVDNDRYRIDGELRQTMLSPRELSSDSLPNRTWINEHLTFTHGYGLTLGPVNDATTEGLPVLLVQDIPPVSARGAPRVRQPAIYYGERSSDHVFVGTDVREFDYPSGERNVYTQYRGAGGIRIDSFLTRLMVALRLGSTQALLSDQIDDGSRVLMVRNVGERVRKLAPFLLLDRDPYLVIRDDGRLVWIQDAYTTTDRYPCAQPSASGLNYLRNSVKVVVDAYDGSVVLYASDERDPILRAWRGAFPRLFTPLVEMPADLRAHLRYPEDIFEVQAQVFATYHMDSAELLYNREDQWEIPSIGGGEGAEGERIEPYYTIMKLPGEAETEFILMLPLTPKSKDNLAAWMAARMDGDRLGEVVVYRFPKDRLVYGPQQIVNRINQDPEISRQISLWDQRGSEAILGTLLVIPIEESLVYVQPLYLQSEGGRIPELKRVVVVYENRIAMAPSLQEAMASIFGGPEIRPPTQPAAVAAEPASTPAVSSAASVAPAPAPAPVGDAAARAREHFERAIAAQRAGDWARYGEELERVGELLRQMAPP